MIDVVTTLRSRRLYINHSTEEECCGFMHLEE